ncbi:MAG: NAD(+) synthase [Rikenellaceae bacterium]
MREFGYFRVASAVPNLRVADCKYNTSQIETMMREAVESGAEVVLFPELSITGYTCGDLFLHDTLIKAAEESLYDLVEATDSLPIVAIVGLPIVVNNNTYNCAVAFGYGEILGVVPKIHIPNYSEFYESRWFASGRDLADGVVMLAGQQVPISARMIFKINGVSCGIEICEDLWVANPPSSTLCEAARVIFNLSASPEVVGKHEYLLELIKQQSARCMAAYVYSSAGCGESSTDLVFGGNGIIAENGRLLATSKRFLLDGHLVVADVDIDLLQNHRLRTTTFQPSASTDFEVSEIYIDMDGVDDLRRDIDRMPFVPSDAARRSERCEEIFAIQTSGLAKRLQHTSCKCAVVGISGGLDSTLALLVTVKAFDRLGLDRKGIIGVTMPGFGTTGRTYNNAVNLIKELGVSLREISIKEACMQHFADIGLSPDDRSVSYENSQARERTQILMDISNMMGGMVVGTGDLSEMALGWATYNGDHMSMYGVNASVPKTLVRYLVGWVADTESNERVGAILRDVIDTPVSPELLPADENGDIAQKTEDLVGPYELHDFFLYHFVRSSFAPSKILYLAQRAFEGCYDDSTIERWLKVFVRRFFMQQFKRSATPDAPKVGNVSLSPRGDWRMPSDAVARVWMDELEGK